MVFCLVKEDQEKNDICHGCYKTHRLLILFGLYWVIVRSEGERENVWNIRVFICGIDLSIDADDS